MYESKVYEVRILVEREHHTENPKVRIYLSPVRQSIWPKVKKICKWVIHMAIRIFISVIITFPFGVWSVRAAYLERGYVAYGGEYLFIAAIFFAIFKISGLITRLKNNKGG